MKIYSTPQGFQCPACLNVMHSDTIKESEDDYKIVLSCPNDRCKHAGKRFEYPKTMMVEAKEIK